MDEERKGDPRFADEILKFRRGLPIFEYFDKIIQTVVENNVKLLFLDGFEDIKR